MSDKAITGVVQVIVAITGVAILALLVSRASQTSAVFGSFGQTVSRMICTALSPVTGKSCSGLTESVNSTVIFGSPVGGS